MHLTTKSIFIRELGKIMTQVAEFKTKEMLKQAALKESVTELEKLNKEQPFIKDQAPSEAEAPIAAAKEVS